MSMLHLTAGFPVTEGLRILERSSAAAGFRFFNISGSEQRRVTYFSKLENMKRFFDLGVVGSSDIILFTDAYDVSIVDHWSVIAARFLEIGVDILFNGESELWPDIEGIPFIGDVSREDIREFSRAGNEGPYPFINSGCYIGYAGAVRELVDETLRVGYEHAIYDDQALVQYFCYMQKEDRSSVIAVDDTDRIFSTMSHSIEEYSFDGFTVRNHLTGTCPSILHSNGPKHTVRVFDIIERIRSICGTNLVLSSVMVGRKFLSYRPGAKRLSIEDVPDHAVTLVSERRGRHVFFTCEGRIVSFQPDGTVDNSATRYHEWECLVREGAGYFVIHPETNRYSLGNYVEGDLADLHTTPVAFRTILTWSDALVSRVLHWAWYW